MELDFERNHFEMKLGKLVCISTLAVTGFADRVNSGNEIKNGYKVSVQFPVHLRSTSGHLSLDIFRKISKKNKRIKRLVFYED